MPKATLSFQIPEESAEFETAVKAQAMSIALSEIRTQVFRPARKHGYSDFKVNELIQKHPGFSEELIGELERLFGEVCEANDVMSET